MAVAAAVAVALRCEFLRGFFGSLLVTRPTVSRADDATAVSTRPNLVVN